MSDFKFACEFCGQKISCDTGYVGRQIACPACQKLLTVPAQPATAPMTPAPLPSAAAMTTAPTTSVAAAPPSAPPPPRGPMEKKVPGKRDLPWLPPEEPKEEKNLPGATRTGYSYLAMASLYCSVFAFIGCIPAIILGHMAKARIRRNPLYNGEEMATGGLVLGYCFLFLMLGTGGAYALIQQHFTPRMTVRDVPTTPPAPEIRVVDQVKPGEYQSEHQHSLLIRGSANTDEFSLKDAGKATKDKDGNYPTAPQRTATGGGSFGYHMKVLPDQPMSVLCRYWGGEVGGYAKFDVIVDDEIIASERLLTNAPGHFFDMEYPVPRSLTKGKSEVVVELQAHPKLRTGKVFELEILKP